AILPLLSNLAYFLAGTDETVEARGVCQFGEAHDLIVRAAFDTGTLEVAFVEACEHRHRDHLGARCGRRFGVFHHRPPATGVDSDDCRLEDVDRLHRPGDRVRNVVQLEIQEDRQADMRNLMHPGMAVRAKELEPELEPAQVSLDLLGQCTGRVELRNVEREIDGIGHGLILGSSVTGTSAAESSGTLWVGEPAGAGGAACTMADARAALSSELRRRS